MSYDVLLLEQAMTVRVSTKGQLVIPKSIRVQAGVHPGSTFDVATDGHRIVLTPRVSYRERLPRTVTTEELLRNRIVVEGPPMTDNDIREAARRGAVARFDKTTHGS
jgi:AbrB family looped-hinge helix DNA binding protein